MLKLGKKSGKKEEKLKKEEKKLCEIGIIRAVRDIPPSHFLWKIKSNMMLKMCNLQRYESGVFEAGDYKWRLALYLKGDINRNGHGHVSLYLNIVNADSFPRGWEVNVSFKFFLYDHKNDNYLMIQDTDIRRFNDMKREWGITKLIPLETFENPLNGYVADCCVFGAEVFVLKPSLKSECHSFESPVDDSYTWKINKFSTLCDEYYDSEVFTIGGRQWVLRIYPKGYTTVKGKSLSLFIYLADDVHEKPDVYANYELIMEDQVNEKHHIVTDFGKYSIISSSSGTGIVFPNINSEDMQCFSSSTPIHGVTKFISLEELHDGSRGFIKSDTLIVKVKFSSMSIVS